MLQLSIGLYNVDDSGLAFCTPTADAASWLSAVLAAAVFLPRGQCHCWGSEVEGTSSGIDFSWSVEYCANWNSKCKPMTCPHTPDLECADMSLVYISTVLHTPTSARTATRLSSSCVSLQCHVTVHVAADASYKSGGTWLRCESSLLIHRCDCRHIQITDLTEHA